MLLYGLVTDLILQGLQRLGKVARGSAGGAGAGVAAAVGGQQFEDEGYVVLRRARKNSERKSAPCGAWMRCYGS